MTTALAPKVSSKTRENWLGRYMGVQRGFDQELFDTLASATKGIDKTLLSLRGKQGEGVAVRRVQLALAHKEIRRQITSLFGDVGNLIRGYNGKAAEAAVEAALSHESRTLSKLFTNVEQRRTYADSLRQSARRNIDAVVTRVLKTEQPLSRRVYKTRALANGMVSRAINDGLARGDSADDIARAVHNLISPKVPGGVSYAAKRLGRTEINNAFHAQTIADAQGKPWIHQMRWHLSKVHKNYPGDPCEDYATIGLFPVESVPDKPHPNCLCYITPEVDDYQQFEDDLFQGHFDPFLEDALKTIQAMEPAPKEEKTTKAAQPQGWTGPPVAKAAANATVRNITDLMWLKYHLEPKFLRVAREGSRKLQTKGYRGGLSAGGKKALLAQENNLIADEAITQDLGRELTARVAYAEPSTERVYRALQLQPIQLARLRKVRGVSMPLSTFENSTSKALGNMSAIQDGRETVVFELANGAKVANVGDSRISLGEFEITAIEERHEPTGGVYHLVKMKQRDAREFDAETSKGTLIPEHEAFELYDKGTPGVKAGEPKPPKLPEPKAPKPRTVSASEIERKIKEAKYPGSIQHIMQEAFPDIKFDGFHDVNLETARGMALAVNDMADRFPVDMVSHATFRDIVQRYGKDYDNAYAVTATHQEKVPSLADVKGYVPWRYHGDIDFTIKYSDIKGGLGNSYTHSIEQKFHPRWDTKVVVGDEEAARAIMTHEIGHALDDRLFFELRNNAEKVVQRAYRKHLDGGGTLTKEQFVTQHRPSKYSLKPTKFSSGSKRYLDTDKVEPAEYVAEAIADVVGNGYENAKLLSQAMWDFAVKASKKPKLWTVTDGIVDDPDYIKGVRK